VLGTIADVGTIIYQPIATGHHQEFIPNEDAKAYIVNGSDYLRFWHVVKNETGRNAAHGRFLIVSGSFYGIEHLNNLDNLITSETDIGAVVFKPDMLYT
jgi:hypothetical protein